MTVDSDRDQHMPSVNYSHAVESAIFLLHLVAMPVRQSLELYQHPVPPPLFVLSALHFSHRLVVVALLGVVTLQLLLLPALLGRQLEAASHNRFEL
jgi:hypothetical protein